MANRGVPQLKYLRLYFCDFGGSSQGVRQFLQSQESVEYMEKNPHVKLEIYMRRGKHPYLSSTYLNGFVKDLPLRNMKEEDIQQSF